MTIGWVREDSLERFLAATEPDLPLRRTRELACPFCVAKLPTTKALYDHLHAAHPVLRPTLLIAGREPASVDEIRRPYKIDEIRTFDCNQIELSSEGRPFQPCTHDQLAQAISKTGMRRLLVRLSNSGSPGGGAGAKTYELWVFLPTAEELELVDRSFVRFFGTERPHIASIPNFVACAEGKASRSYADALSEYVRGVLVKDRDPQTGIHGSAVDWSDAYKRAVNVLKEVDRPLPILISGVIRFALNDFSRWEEPTEFVALNHTVRILGNLADVAEAKLEHPPVQPDRIRGVCPLDSGVSRVIELGSRYSMLDRWSSIDSEDVTRLANLPELGALDRAKVRALWAWTTLRLGARQAAVEPLSAIAGHDCFGAWAQMQLEGIVS